MDFDPIPFERIRFFKAQVGLDQDCLQHVEPYRETFAASSRRFGDYFYDYFHGLANTRLVLMQHSPNRGLAQVLAMWFESLFRDRLGENFLSFLWHSGVRHVRMHLDQRFVNLGYAATRKFCQGLVDEHVPSGERRQVGLALDKILDFCVLVATDSFVSTSSRWDRAVMEGIAHQVRNPVTVIGGSMGRLLRRAEEGSRERETFQTVMEETRRLSRMVDDVSRYTGLFKKDPAPQAVSPSDLLADALKQLRGQRDISKVDLRCNEMEDAPPVLVDPAEGRVMVHCLLENAVEHCDQANPWVRAFQRPGPENGYWELVLENSGRSPDPAAMSELLSPFYSTRPDGTGFGLPIADLIARRNLATISLQGLPGGTGARVVILLPLAPEAG